LADRIETDDAAPPALGEAAKVEIIVVGILTALAGEQTVEWLHNRSELEEARHALKAEMTVDAQIVTKAIGLTS
jgi:hypothetical protein